MTTPATTEVITSALRSLDFMPPIRFTARQSRAVECLARGPAMREVLDGYIGCSNAPEIVRQLRNKGVSIDCQEVKSVDRDGKPCYPGKYSLTYKGRMTLEHWGLL